jgi:hypothetical protein
MRRTGLKHSAAGLALAVWLPGAWAGPFVNGAPEDFTSAEGLIRDTSTLELVAADPLTDATHFELDGTGFARLQNSVDYYEVILLQTLDLAPTAQTLSFHYAWSLTAGDPDNPDFVQATLFWLDDFDEFIDLFPPTVDTSAPTGAGITITDISAFAGRTVLLEFLVQDGDFDERDWFEIGRRPAPIPLPTTLSLLLVGAGVLGLHRRQSAPHESL